MINVGNFLIAVDCALDYLGKFVANAEKRHYKKMIKEIFSEWTTVAEAMEQYESEHESGIQVGGYKKACPECSIGSGIRELSEEEKEIIRRRKERRKMREQKLHNKEVMPESDLNCD